MEFSPRDALSRAKSHMSLERLNNLPEDTVKPNFVVIFIFCGTAASFIDKICFSVAEAKREAILFFFVYSEVNSSCYSAS